jgi:hypothetical protein|tara:strand:- start:4659 stop:4793 length:135 start_codon:yes stop_codon:yes gene_type:complete
MEEELSNCCGASRWCETDICSDCKEHAEFNEEQEEPDPYWENTI